MKDSIDLTIWDKIKQFFNFELDLSKYYNYVIAFNDRKTIVEDYKELEKNTSRNISSQYQKQLESEEKQRIQDLKLMKVIDEKNALVKKLKASENSGK